MSNTLTAPTETRPWIVRTPPRQRPARLRLSLIGGFVLARAGTSVSLPVPAQRLLALLALSGGPVRRGHVAGVLWLESPEERAAASLRSALWRVRQAGRELVETDGGHVRLGGGVRVDVHEAAAWAKRVVDPAYEPGGADVRTERAFGDLLPDWYDDWVVFERERFRQARVHALETLCARLTDAGRYGEAIEIGLAAVRAEPLRESAHRAVIAVHVAHGNHADAVRQLEAYRVLLARDLGVAPSPQIEALVAG